MKGLEFRIKTEKRFFSSGNLHAKSGFETKKHLFFPPNSSFANGDTLHIPNP